MPVEIRELVIRAQVPDKTDASSQSAPPVQMAQGNTVEPVDAGDAPLNPEWVQKVADICLKELKSWLIEKSIR